MSAAALSETVEAAAVRVEYSLLAWQGSVGFLYNYRLQVVNDIVDDARHVAACGDNKVGDVFVRVDVGEKWTRCQ